jgi:hypothetical protein
LQELIVDPKNLGHTPSDLEAAPGSHPNPLVSHGSGASSSSGASEEGGAGTGLGGADAAAGALQRLALSQDDHPLSTSSSSRWQAYFQVGAWAGGRLCLHTGQLRSLSPQLGSAVPRWLAGGTRQHSLPACLFVLIAPPPLRCRRPPPTPHTQDVEVQEQIERDVARTHPDMHFFSAASRAAEQHRAQMRRALFVFAKLNPGLRYVQVGRLGGWAGWQERGQQSLRWLGRNEQKGAGGAANRDRLR